MSDRKNEVPVPERQQTPVGIGARALEDASGDVADEELDSEDDDFPRARLPGIVWPLVFLGSAAVGFAVWFLGKVAR